MARAFEIKRIIRKTKNGKTTSLKFQPGSGANTVDRYNNPFKYTMNAERYQALNRKGRRFARKQVKREYLSANADRVAKSTNNKLKWSTIAGLGSQGITGGTAAQITANQASQNASKSGTPTTANMGNINSPTNLGLTSNGRDNSNSNESSNVTGWMAS